MCLIIQTDTPKNLNRDLLECAYENNSDGFGLMLFNQGKVHTHKIVPKTFADVEKMWKSYKDMDIPMALHFRFNTHGETSRAMSHPFQVLNKQDHGRDLWLMHNGPNLPTPMIDKGKSDTHQFIKWVIRPQLLNNPNLLYNAEWTESLEDLIGSDKLLFLDGKTQEFTIINQGEGKNVKNVGWVSNTYSISRGVGYDYDIDLGKKVATKKSWSGWLNDYDMYGNYQGGNIQYDNTYSTSWDSLDEDLTSNGQQLTDDMLCGLTVDEMIEVAETNPVGMAMFVHDLYDIGNKK